MKFSYLPSKLLQVISSLFYFVIRHLAAAYTVERRELNFNIASYYGELNEN